jgi:hypothetical protein
LIVPIPSIVWKLSHYEYHFKQFTNSAVTNYDLKITFHVPDSLIGKKGAIHFDVPSSNIHQRLKKPQLSSADFNCEIVDHGDHRSMVLSNNQLPTKLHYSCQYYSKQIHFHIAPTAKIATTTGHFISYRHFQSAFNHFHSDQRAETWMIQKHLTIRKVIGFDLNSSCNHPITWIEVLIGKHWIPFSINHHFSAMLPANILKYGNADQSLLTATTKNIHLTSQSKKIIHPETIAKLEKNGFNLLFMNRLIEENNLPTEILTIILLTPLAALLIVLLRNTIGISTFGLFLPMLLAMSFLSTGFVIGSILFIAIIAIISLVHYPLEKFELLNLPKLAIVLTFVELLFLLAIYLGAKFEMNYILHISLFPVVIITFSSERFSKVATEKNYRTAFALTLRTLAVAGIAYLIYDSTFFSLLFQAFPEVILFIIATNLFLGKWIGLRLSEIYRFKSLLQ